VPVAKDTVTIDEDHLLYLTALGTVADLAPLVGENRSLVSRGLERLNDPQRLGVRALLRQTGLRLGQVDATAIGFVLGPRLNAAGRVDDAATSYDLLTCRSPDKAAHLAQELDGLNRLRQTLTTEAFNRAKAEVLAGDGSDKLLFAAGEGFQSGIVGLVAGRLAEEFYRPVLIVELGPGRSRGSARSIPEFDITAALDQCSGLLVKHGGHAAAAGFTVANDNLEALQERLKELAAEQLDGVELAPTLSVDAEIELSEADWATQALLAQLEPCGQANPTPLLLSRRATVLNSRAVGAGGKHLKLTLIDGYARPSTPTRPWDAIAFHQGEWAGRVPPRIDIVYSLEVNDWQGKKRLQLNVKDLRPSA
jgi:single-stranded-DNA-specific exonuclease